MLDDLGEEVLENVDDAEEYQDLSNILKRRNRRLRKEVLSSMKAFEKVQKAVKNAAREMLPQPAMA